MQHASKALFIALASCAQPVDCAANDVAHELEKGSAAEYDAVIAIGGDGTVNSVGGAMCTFEGWHTKPLLVVPTGDQNSIATSLNILNDVDAVAALSTNARLQVPVWELRVEEAKQLFFGSVNIGTFADTVAGAHWLRSTLREFVAIPQVKHRYWASGVWAALKHSTVPVAVSYRAAQEQLGASGTPDAGWKQVDGPPPSCRAIPTSCAAPWVLSHTNSTRTWPTMPAMLVPDNCTVTVLADAHAAPAAAGREPPIACVWGRR